MVSSDLLSVLGRATYSSKMYGMLTLLCSHRRTPRSTVRYLRSDLPPTRTNFNSFDDRSYSTTRDCTSKAVRRRREVVLKSLPRTPQGSYLFRKVTHKDDLQFRLQMRRPRHYAQHQNRKIAQSKDAPALPWPSHHRFAQLWRCLHPVRTRWHSSTLTRCRIPSYSLFRTQIYPSAKKTSLTLTQLDFENSK